MDNKRGSDTSEQCHKSIIWCDFLIPLDTYSKNAKLKIKIAVPR